ncbi:hypothetical protein AALP_AA1G114000 [Arabis alpina]|uniref:Uncharacterized protein n=1 Tax=Arabis alpina TaxID=50452 RepID=A0A087HMJ6_ARAAL|nr:hypothetical protein AALP_AA1G114000 [Arabis alpina]
MVEYLRVQIQSNLVNMIVKKVHVTHEEDKRFRCISGFWSSFQKNVLLLDQNVQQDVM